MKYVDYLPFSYVFCLIMTTICSRFARLWKTLDNINKKKKKDRERKQHINRLTNQIVKNSLCIKCSMNTCNWQTCTIEIKIEIVATFKWLNNSVCLCTTLCLTKSIKQKKKDGR